MYDANEVFAANIRKNRLSINWTQEKLAASLEVTPETVSNWENGTVIADVAEMCALARVFHVSLNSMCGLENGISNYWIYKMQTSVFDPSLSFDSLWQIWKEVEVKAPSDPLNDMLLCNMLNYLRFLHDKSETKKQRDAVNAQILRISERILDFSRNESYRSFANYNLALYYNEKVVLDRCRKSDITNARLAKKFADSVIFIDMQNTLFVGFGSTTTEERKAAKEKCFFELLDLTKRSCNDLLHSDNANQASFAELMQQLCAIEEKASAFMNNAE